MEGVRADDNVDRTLRMAADFIMKLFDDDLDGKLGRSELDRFFGLFNSDGDDDKEISWAEFVRHGAELMEGYRRKTSENDEEKARVPTRAELKAEAHRAVHRNERARRKEANAPPPPRKQGAQGGRASASASTRTPSTTTYSAIGERSRGARPAMS